MMDDLISRKAAIDAVSRGCQEFRGIFAECEKNLNDLPPAQPKTGKWIKNGNKYTCPFCGTGFTTVSEEVRSAHKYCYYCGAKMGDTDER